MSEFKRKRIYYTKAQITTGLVTEGKEWMFNDNTEYIGQYHIYTTDEVFSEANFIKDKSRQLIPYIDVNDFLEPSLGVDFDKTKNFLYDSIKTIDVIKSKTPSPAIISPVEKDFKRGYMERYFASKINDENILELNKEQYSKVGQEDGLDGVLWKKFKLRWKVSGPLYDVIDNNTKIRKESGIIDTNLRTIALKAEEYPDLVDILVDLKEFSE
jgi:hypothetical protein|tara:strand:+ start:1020 stop:1658 length:639 start_codon:yes stop_codon:yes gene_type:complete